MPAESSHLAAVFDQAADRRPADTLAGRGRGTRGKPQGGSLDMELGRRATARLIRRRLARGGALPGSCEIDTSAPVAGGRTQPSSPAGTRPPPTVAGSGEAARDTTQPGRRPLNSVAVPDHRRATLCTKPHIFGIAPLPWHHGNVSWLRSGDRAYSLIGIGRIFGIPALHALGGFSSAINRSSRHGEH
jgi:hypothetical protein